MDYRKVILSLIIGFLVVFFIQSSIEAFKETPSYSDFCDLEYPSRVDLEDEDYEKEMEEYRALQEECRAEYDEARDEYNSFVFVFSLIGAAVSIVLALYLPLKGGAASTISTGLLLGGLFSIFIGTIRGWSSMSPEFRPVILLLELILIIVVSYKTLK